MNCWLWKTFGILEKSSVFMVDTYILEKWWLCITLKQVKNKGSFLVIKNSGQVYNKRNTR